MSKDDLLLALQRAAGRKMTAEEIRAQRVSFVLSTLDDASDDTRVRVEKKIDEMEGKAA